MNRTISFLVLVLLLLMAIPTAQATWTSTANVPAAFRPDRTVSFSFTVQSGSGFDGSLQWQVRLVTCQDADVNTFCASGEPQYVDHGEKPVNLLAGQSATLTWNVILAQPEGAYRYHFHTRCSNNPCAGEPAGGAHNKTGSFHLRYTDTWTRTIFATSPTRADDTQTIQYELRSTSLDDRGLSGTAQLYSAPYGEQERDHGAQAFVVNAGQQVTLSWPGVDFPTVGTQQLRATDTTGADNTLEVEVRGVHLHVVQPRAHYTAGNTFGLYLTLEGHGATPDPDPIDKQQVHVTIYNGTFAVAHHTLLSDASGQAYLSFQTAEDHQNLTWQASATVTWLGADYDAEANGTILVQSADIADDVSAIRESLDELQFKGVHLDELGSRHVFLTSVRAVGAVALVIILVLLVIYIAIRV